MIELLVLHAGNRRVLWEVAVLVQQLEDIVLEDKVAVAKQSVALIAVSPGRQKARDGELGRAGRLVASPIYIPPLRPVSIPVLDTPEPVLPTPQSCLIELTDANRPACRADDARNALVEVLFEVLVIPDENGQHFVAVQIVHWISSGNQVSTTCSATAIRKAVMSIPAKKAVAVPTQ